MAEQEYTEAGKLGRKIRSALGNALESTKIGVIYLDDAVKEYGQE